MVTRIGRKRGKWIISLVSSYSEVECLEALSVSICEQTESVWTLTLLPPRSTSPALSIFPVCSSALDLIVCWWFVSASLNWLTGYEPNLQLWETDNTSCERTKYISIYRSIVLSILSFCLFIHPSIHIDRSIVVSFVVSFIVIRCRLLSFVVSFVMSFIVSFVVLFVVSFVHSL